MDAENIKLTADCQNGRRMEFRRPPALANMKDLAGDNLLTLRLARFSSCPCPPLALAPSVWLLEPGCAAVSLRWIGYAYSRVRIALAWWGSLMKV